MIFCLLNVVGKVRASVLEGPVGGVGARVMSIAGVRYPRVSNISALVSRVIAALILGETSIHTVA